MLTVKINVSKIFLETFGFWMAFKQDDKERSGLGFICNRIYWVKLWIITNYTVQSWLGNLFCIFIMFLIACTALLLMPCVLLLHSSCTAHSSNLNRIDERVLF